MRCKFHLSTPPWGATVLATALIFHAAAPTAAAADVNSVLGVVTQFEAPLAGMEVDLTVAGRLLAATRTDGYGRFAFRGVTPGPYEIVTRGVVHDIIRVGPPAPIVVQPPPGRPTSVRVQVPGP